MSINQIQDKIIEEFSYFDDWYDKYEYLISLGKKINPLEENFKTEKHAIKGCQSRVWIVTDIVDGKVSLKGDSDALITKGILSQIIRVFNLQTPADIKEADIYFHEKTGLLKNLSPSRANGMVSMINQIKYNIGKFI